MLRPAGPFRRESRDLPRGHRSAQTQKTPLLGGGRRDYRCGWEAPQRASGEHPFSREVALQPLGEVMVDAGRGRNLLDRCLLDAPHAAEALEQRILARRTDARHVVELRMERPLAPDVAVVGDREAMRLVANPLDEVETLAGSQQHDGRGLIRDEELLE